MARTFTDQDFLADEAQAAPAQPAKPRVFAETDFAEEKPLPRNANGSTESKPIGKSPLTAMESLDISVADPKTKKQLLESRFEQVVQHPEKGIVVKDGGKWKQLDPSFFGNGDPWEATRAVLGVAWKGTRALLKTMGGDVESAKEEASGAVSDAGTAVKQAAKSVYGVATQGIPNFNVQEFTRDMAESGPEITNAIASTIGGRLAGPYGAAALSVPATLMKTTLGKVRGVYKASPWEETQDVMIEAFLNFGAEKVAPGARANMDQAWTAFKKIGSTADDNVKATLTSIISKTAAQNRTEAVEHLFKSPDNVNRVKAVLKEYVPSVKEVTQGTRELREAQIKNIKEMLQDGIRTKSLEYGKRLKSVVEDSGGEKLLINREELAENLLKSIQEEGLGVVQRKPVRKMGTKVDSTYGVSSTEEVIEKGPLEFIMAEDLPSVTKNKLKEFVDVIIAHGKKGDVKGKEAVESLLKLDRRFNDTSRALLSGTSDPAFSRAVTRVNSALHEVVRPNFDKVGLGKKYADALAYNTRYADSINWARNVLDSNIDDKAETVTKQLMTAGPNNQSKRTAMGNIEELLGARGKAYKEKASDLFAAETFAPWASRMSFPGAATVGAASGSTVGILTQNPALGGAVATGVTAAAYAAGKPRMALKAIELNTKLLPYATAMGDFIKAQTPENVKKIIKSPELFNAIMRTTLLSSVEEEQMRGTLLQKSGL